MEFNEAAMKEILTALKEVSSKGFVTFDEVENNLDKMKFDLTPAGGGARRPSPRRS